MPTKEQAAPANGNKPVHTVRHRSIKASIWKNETSAGPMYTVTIVRSWRDDQGWHDGQSFGYDDLMNVSALMYEAHAFISSVRAKEAAAPQRQPAGRS
jgi:hypothetical protein